METPVRLWRTENDDELVLDNDPAAKILAYGEGDEVADEDEAAAKKALKGADAKQADQAQDKQAEAPADKSRKPATKKS